MRRSSVFLIYLVSTIIFLIGHYVYLGWDFSVYVLNAQYWFANGSYFEIERAPLMSFLIGFFSIFGWTAAEYIYIAFSSALYLYATIKLGETLRVRILYFVLFSLNAFVLLFGLVEGTELLSLALLSLFLVSLYKDKSISGFYLGLACLTRYTFVLFFILLLFHKTWRKRIVSGILYCIPFIPWFIYNKIHYGNIFYSIASSVSLNVIYRDYIVSSINYINFIYAWNFLIPLIILGFIMYLYRERINRRSLILFSYTLICLYMVYTLKSNIVRYFIILTIPGAYFATYALKRRSKKFKNTVLTLFIILSLVVLPIAFLTQGFHSQGYDDIIEKISFTEGCAIKTNIWVPLNYNGIASEPFPREDLVGYYIDEGYYLLFKYGAREPYYIFNESFMQQFPVVFDDEDYILLGEGCVETNAFDMSYLERLNEQLLLAYDYTVSEDPCEILFHNSSICYFVNDVFAV